MKKMFLLAGICLALVSCKNDENDIPDNGVKSECKVSCLLTTTGENPQSFPVYNVPFVFKYEFVNNTITLSTDMLGLSLNNKLSFVSDPVNFVGATYSEGMALKFEVPSINTKMNGVYNSKYNITDLECLFTDIYFCPDSWRNNNPRPLGDMVIMECEIGDEYILRTFPLIAGYRGTSTTSFAMGGKEQSYMSDVPLYAVAIDPNTNKAEVGLYNAKFAEPMPQLTMYLRGLNVEYTAEGYKIYASEEGVVPLVGNDLIPYPDYIFNNFELVCKGEKLTDINVNFQVAGKFNGRFNGSFTSVAH